MHQPHQLIILLRYCPHLTSCTYSQRVEFYLFAIPIDIARKSRGATEGSLYAGNSNSCVHWQATSAALSTSIRAEWALAATTVMGHMFVSARQGSTAAQKPMGRPHAHPL